MLLLVMGGCGDKCIDFEDNFTLINSIITTNEVIINANLYSCRFNQAELDTLVSFKNDNKITIYNIRSDRLEFNVDLDELGSLVYRDHLFHTPDSIFVCAIFNGSVMFILLMNRYGEIYTKWNINELTEPLSEGIFYVDSRYNHPMVLIQDKLYFQASYRLKPGSVYKSNVPIEMVLDLKRGITKQFGDLPEVYKTGLFFGNHQKDYARVLDGKNQLVFSFPISHDLYIYDSTGRFIKTVKCKSRFIEKIKPIEPDEYSDLSAIIDAYTYHAQYSDLVYDKYQKFYYRTVLHKLDKYNHIGEVNKPGLRKWSIMILDENLKLKKEIIMPEEIFWKRILFTKEGLVLKSVSNKAVNEYQVFKFQPCLN